MGNEEADSGETSEPVKAREKKRVKFVITNEKLIPARFMKEPEPDMEKLDEFINSHLKEDGRDVPYGVGGVRILGPVE